MNISELRKHPHWSYSALNTYLNVCQLQYYFRYIEQAEVEQTSACFAFGRAFHFAMSNLADIGNIGSAFSVDELMDFFEQHFYSELQSTPNVKFKRNEDEDFLMELARKMLAVSLDNWHEYYNVKSVSETFSIDVPFLDKPLIGEFDLVVSDGSESCIVDWKTSATRWATGKADRDLQATVFSYAYLKKHGELPTFRFDVVTKTKSPTYDFHFTERNEDDFQRFIYLAQKVQESINKGVFLPSETCYSCSSCAYANRCKSIHRKV